MIGATRSRKQFDDLGIYSHDIKLLTENIISTIIVRKNAMMAACDMVTLKSKERTESVDTTLNSNQIQLKRKQLD